MKLKVILVCAFLALLLVGAAVFRLLITRGVEGELSFAFPATNILTYRLVPLSAALIVGSALGVSGMGLQVLLRNPLLCQK